MIADFYAEDGAMYADALLAKTALESAAFPLYSFSSSLCGAAAEESFSVYVQQGVERRLTGG